MLRAINANHFPAVRYIHAKAWDAASIRAILCFIVFLASIQTNAQAIENFLKPSDTLNKKRRTAVYLSQAAISGFTLSALYTTWYTNYPQTNFHLKNDNTHWHQLDKIGHFYSAYHLGNLGAQTLAWSGASKKEKIYYGATLGWAFLSVVEIFDGFSSQWGASYGDILANTAGTGLYIFQESVWKEQRITPKFSVHTTKYAPLRPNTLGNSFSEQILKDYNGQTYWLSFNIQSFINKNYIPKWLNVAVGYGANGMLYATDKEALKNSYQQNSYKQYFLSFDIDLTKIKTNSQTLSTLFSIFNTIKVPLPTLEITENKVIKGHLIYF